jgi:hypothetical protein
MEISCGFHQGRDGVGVVEKWATRPTVMLPWKHIPLGRAIRCGRWWRCARDSFAARVLNAAALANAQCQRLKQIKIVTTALKDDELEICKGDDVVEY